MFRVIFGVLAIGILCAVGFAQYGEPAQVGSARPEPLPVRQERTMYPVMPYCPPQTSAPLVVQSANDTAMLEAVRQGKDFRLEITLRDPTERQWHEAMEWRGATQYQQQPYTVAPYQQPMAYQYQQPQYQYRQQRQYYYGEQNVDVYGRACWFWGYNLDGTAKWMTCPPPARQNCW